MKVSRRCFLSATVLSVSLSGCTSNPSPSNREDSGESDYISSERLGEVSVDRQIEDSVDYDVKYIEYYVENTSNEVLTPVELSGILLSSDGNVIEERGVEVGKLGPGEVWRAFVPAYPRSSVESVASVDVFIEYSLGGVFENPLKIEDSHLDPGNERNAPEIIATMSNTRDTDYPHPDIYGRFFDSDGIIIGVGSNGWINSIPPGYSVEVNISQSPWISPDQAPSSYDMVLFG